MDKSGADARDAGLVYARPPASFQPVATWRLDSVAHIAALRRELQDAVGTSHDPTDAVLGEVPEHMVLVASELATNALSHGDPPTLVSLLSNGVQFLLDVADHDLSNAPQVVTDRPTGAGGFGLQIAQHLAHEIGWYASARTKHVWVTFPAGR